MKVAKVFGKNIPIKKQKGLIEQNCAAFYCYDTDSITIDSSLKGEQLTATLLHEMGHALFRRAGLEQSKIPTCLEEIIVEQFATVVIENFKLTPKK